MAQVLWGFYVKIHMFHRFPCCFEDLRAEQTGLEWNLSQMGQHMPGIITKKYKFTIQCALHVSSLPVYFRLLLAKDQMIRQVYEHVFKF